MLARLSVEDAARHLGLSQATVKRRLKRGTLRGEQEPTPAGFKWYVIVDDAATPATAAATPGATATAIPGVAPETPPATPPPPLLASRRAQEMAAYTEELLAPWRAQVAELSQRVGRLEAELAHARANDQAETRNGAAEPWPERRRWWQRLLWG